MHKNIIIWGLFILMMILVFNLFNAPKGVDEIGFSEFMSRVENGEVVEVTIEKPANLITGILKDGMKFKSFAPDYPDLVKELRDKGVIITAKPDQRAWYLDLLFSFGPILLLVILWIYFMRQIDRKSTRLNSSHIPLSRMPSSA